MNDLDCPGRQGKIKSRILGKAALYRLYQEFYFRFADCINKFPGIGSVIEIGSGVGFIKDVVPDVITSDILPYNTADVVFDARGLSFRDSSIKAVFMLNCITSRMLRYSSIILRDSLYLADVF